MLFFGKKQKKEDEETVDESSDSKKPRRKKKEPPKPWGKRERFLVLFFLVITVGASGFLSLSARNWKLPNLPRLHLGKPNIAIPFLTEETIVIEGRKTDQNKASKVIDFFTSETDKLSGVYGLYVVHLDNGFSYGVYEHDVFQAASLIKLPVIAAMYQEAEAGNIDLDAKYTLKSSDKVAGAGSLYSKPAGYEITYRNLIRLMGKESDNTAFNICRKILGDDKISEVATKIGMRNTSLEDNETTPEDIGTFFQELWDGNVVNSEHKEEILDYLTDTLYEAWLTEGIPQVRVAHKYGREVHVVNDAGIVYADKPFVLVILTGGVVERDADETIPKLAREIYNIEAADQ